MALSVVPFGGGDVTQRDHRIEAGASGTSDPDFEGPAVLPAALRRDQAGQPLHCLVREHLNTFLARFEDEHRGRRLPRYVEEEFRALLRCGDPTYGFARLQCHSCSSDLLVPFSCKGRTFCPSCGGRRMAEIAAHLVERVLPPVPVRQWVLSLPWHLRYALAGDPVLLRAVARAFLRAVDASYRRRARRQLFELSTGGANHQATAARKRTTKTPPRLTPGAVNFVQRFGSSLALNIHFHALYIDGVHVDRGPSAPPEFLPAPELQPEEVARVNADAIRRIHRALRRAGRPDLVRSMDGDIDHNATAAEPPTDDPGGSLLPFLHAASIQDRIALGPEAGRPIPRLQDPAADLRPASQGLANPPSLTAESHGFSLHAATRVEAGDPERLERLVSYVARTPLSQGRFQVRKDGKVKWTLRRPPLRLGATARAPSSSILCHSWSVSPPWSPIRASTPGPITVPSRPRPPCATASSLPLHSLPPPPQTATKPPTAELGPSSSSEPLLWTSSAAPTAAAAEGASPSSRILSSVASCSAT